MPARFDRYKLTAGYNAVINQRQFGIEGLTWPTEYRYPDRTYRDAAALDIGDVRFELHHARGETDDHTWTYVPDHEIICTGDLFIWASPNEMCIRDRSTAWASTGPHRRRTGMKRRIPPMPRTPSTPRPCHV